MMALRPAMTEADPRPIAAIVLAAGKGTRMRSARHKVLHEIAGRPMLEHLLASLAELAPARTVVVVGGANVFDEIYALCAEAYGL